MARQNISIVERHVEKGVFGITALVLLGVAFQYLLSSPNSVDIDGTARGPGEVDLAVKVAADRLRQKVQNAPLPKEAGPQFKKAWEVTRGPLDQSGLAALLRRAVAYRPPILALDSKDLQIGPGSRSVTLAQVVTPGKPLVRRGRNLVQMNPLGYIELTGTDQMGAPRAMPSRQPVGGRFSPRGSGHGGGHGGERDDEEESPIRRNMPRQVNTRRPTMRPGGPATVISDPSLRKDVNWATVYFTFNKEEQQGLCKEADYSPAMREITFTWPEIQRRTLRDGVPSGWQTVETFEPYVRPETPALVKGPDGQLEITAQAKLDLFVDTIRATQPEIMRPAFLQLISGKPWDIPKLEGVELDVFDYEGDGRFPDLLQILDPNYIPVEGEANDGRPWWMVQRDLLRQEQEALRKAEQLAARLDRLPPEQAQAFLARQDLKLARELMAKKDYEGAAVVVMGVVFNELLPVGMHDQAQVLLDEINQHRIERQRKEMQKFVDQQKETEIIQAGGMGIGGPAITMLWAHDLTVEPGATYQYRARIRLYNAYVYQPDQLKNEEDGRKLILTSDWSEPSDPVTIEPDAHFFLTSATRGKARVRVYKWFQGQWVKSDFPVEIGKKIGDKASRIPVADPFEPIRRRLPVDFTSAYTVVDLDFDRPVPASTNGAISTTGLAPARPKTTLAMVYDDPASGLLERILAIDSKNPLRKDLERQVFKPVPTVKQQDRQVRQRTVRNAGRRGGGHGNRGGGGRRGGDGGRRRRGRNTED